MVDGPLGLALTQTATTFVSTRFLRRGGHLLKVKRWRNQRSDEHVQVNHIIDLTFSLFLYRSLLLFLKILGID